MPTRTAWTPTAATGEEVSQTDFRSIPGGLVGYAVMSSSHTGITADADITGLTVTLTLVLGRKYRVTLTAHVQATAGGGNFGVDIMDGANRVQISRATTTSTNVISKTVMCLLTGDGSSHTIKGAFDVISAGTYSVLTNTATNPTLLLVEDVGPTF